MASNVSTTPVEDENLGATDTVVSAVLLVLSTVFVILRVVARRMKSIWGPDDWLCIFAQVTLLISGVLNYIQIANGLGRHMVFVSPDQLSVILQCLLANEVFYNVSMVSIKFSLSFLFLRLFPPLKRRVYLVAGFVAAWGVSFTVALLLQCQPVHKFWQPWRPGACVDPRPIFVTNAVLNFFSDIALLCMPIAQVVKLEIRTSVKVSICSIFLMGGFVSFAGLYRIRTLMAVDPADATWTFDNSNIWTLIEISCAIISACLPTLRLILAKVSAIFFSLNSRDGGAPSAVSGAAAAAARERRTRPVHDRLDLFDDTTSVQMHSQSRQSENRCHEASRQSEESEQETPTGKTQVEESNQCIYVL